MHAIRLRAESPAGCTVRAAIPSRDRATISIATTTSATISTHYGSARPWRTPAPTTRAEAPPSIKPRSPKMDHVCRKVRLSASDSVVEAGCGWGSLALHMAARYGAKVRAFNISHEQIDYARRQARGARPRRIGSSSSRTITATSSGSLDVFVSVGMLEHVGRENYPGVGACHEALIDGRMGAGWSIRLGATGRNPCIRGSNGESFPAPTRPRSAK